MPYQRPSSPLLPYRSMGLALSLAFACVARADDWTMFRKDAGRTAASTDQVQLPLRTAWTWTSKPLAGKSSVSTVAVRKGKVYVIGAYKREKGFTRALHCLDADTGAEVWKADLKGERVHPFFLEDIGPVVGDDGSVYVVGTTIENIPCPTRMIYVAAFDSATGRYLESHIAPLKNNLGRFFVRPEGHRFLTPSTKPST